MRRWAREDLGAFAGYVASIGAEWDEWGQLAARDGNLDGDDLNRFQPFRADIKKQREPYSLDQGIRRRAAAYRRWDERRSR